MKKRCALQLATASIMVSWVTGSLATVMLLAYIYIYMESVHDEESKTKIWEGLYLKKDHHIKEWHLASGEG